MELYTLDEQLRRARVVEGYESLIWTERYSTWGDFELIIRSSREARNLLPVDTRLALDRSHRVMTVETVEESINDDGEETLTITGRSLEALLDDRVAMPQLGPLETEEPDPDDPDKTRTVSVKWEFTDKPADIARSLFQVVCVDGAISEADKIPFYEPGNILPLGTIPEPQDVVTIAFEPDTLYNSLKEVCDTYNLGFRILRDGDNSRTSFEVYTGDNRMSNQTTFPAVIFSPEMENLTNTAQLTSTAKMKNVAYVFAKNGATEVLAPGADPDAAGFERRVLFVKADNIDGTSGTDLEIAMQQRGLQELAKHRTIFNFDGEIPEFGSYEYGVDYNLGDLVEQRNADGFSTEMRVTEQIFVSDAEGERAYPTLSINIVANPGTWRSMGSKTWSQMQDEEYWGNA